MERGEAGRPRATDQDPGQADLADGSRGAALRLYLDTSALLKIYIDEVGSPLVREQLAGASAVATSLVTYVEARGALARRRKRGDLTRSEHATILRAFEIDWERLSRIDVTDDLIRAAAGLADSYRLRAYDAVHLASAIAVRARPGSDLMFGSWDEDLDRAAAREGLSVLRSRTR